MQKLDEILRFYQQNHSISEEIDDIKQELLDNNVEVKGDSFFCPIWNKELNAWLLLAGTKDHADMWVMKKIIKLIKSGDTIYSVLNGNIEYLIDKLRRYDVEVISEQDGMAYISFNKKEK